MATRNPTDPAQLAAMLLDLHQRRETGKAKVAKRGRTRRQLTAKQRELVLAKTDGRCHICAGSVNDEPWQADHVMAHSGGGLHSVENYLPAHALCNNYRWDYLAEEFQWILKIGVWSKRQIELKTALGRELAARLSAHERTRIARQRPKRRRD